MLTTPARPRRHSRAGMTMMEVIVAIAIVALLAGVVVPRVLDRLTQGQAGALSTTIAGLSDAILAFRADTGRYPRRLSLLSTQITSSSRDSCGAFIADSASWRGPYLDRAITPAAGLTVGNVVIADSLRRDPLVASATVRVGTLTIVATGVDQAVANRLEAAVDGNANLSSGTVRWSSGSNGTLTYAMVIRGC